MTTVTTFSKYLALSMLIIFPICAFFLGRYYQKTTDVAVGLVPKPSVSSTPTTDTSCNNDSDCTLINIEDYQQKNNMNVCCGRVSCSPQDLSQSNWVAKNIQWKQNQKDVICGTKRYMCPMIAQCNPQHVDENFEAKCMSSVCQKVAKPKTGAGNY